MLPESLLLNYGILGIWTTVLLYDRYQFQKEMKSVLMRNNELLSNVAHIKLGCPHNKISEVLKNGN